VSLCAAATSCSKACRTGQNADGSPRGRFSEASIFRAFSSRRPDARRRDRHQHHRGKHPKPQGISVQQGPVFTNVLLADEINRATPKTQSALLEAMQEHSVTVAERPINSNNRSLCWRRKTRSKWKAPIPCRSAARPLFVQDESLVSQSEELITFGSHHERSVRSSRARR
jgi:hypothetical protein